MEKLDERERLIAELRNQVADLQLKNVKMYAALSRIAYMGKRYNVFSERKTMREIARGCIHEIRPRS